MNSKYFIIRTTVFLLLISFMWPHHHALAKTSDNLVAYYTFDGTAADTSGQDLNGTVNNASFVPGYLSSALSFVSDASFVEVPHNDLLSPTNAVSISLWVNVRSFPNSYCCLAYKAAINPTSSGFQDRSYSLWVRSDGGIHWTSTAEGASTQSVCDSPAGGIPIGQWMHVVAVVDVAAQVMKIYINGKEAALSPYSSAGINYGTFPLRLGGPFITGGDQTGLDGLLDEVRIYDRALSAEEASSLSVPVLRIQMAAGSQAEISWGSQLNATYQLLYSSNLVSSSWHTLVSDVQGNGTTNSVFDPIVLGEPARFYRLVVTNSIPLVNGM